MNKGISTVLGVLVLGASVAYADGVNKVTITQSPIVVQDKDGVYMPQAPLTTGQDYYYLQVQDPHHVTGEPTEQVCYETVQNQFKDVSPTTRVVMINEQKVTMHCYTPSPEYFTIETTTIAH